MRWSTIAIMLGLSACYSVDDRHAPQRLADGESTFISGSHPKGNLLGPAAYPARVGARRRFTQYIALDSSTGTRVATRGGMVPEREFFRY